MSQQTRTDKRHVLAYGCEVKNLSRDKVQFVVFGETESGRNIHVKIDTSWSNWTCIARNFAKAWADQRASRVLELHNIDSALPKEQS